MAFLATNLNQIFTESIDASKVVWEDLTTSATDISANLTDGAKKISDDVKDSVDRAIQIGSDIESDTADTVQFGITALLVLGFYTLVKIGSGGVNTTIEKTIGAIKK